MGPKICFGLEVQFEDIEWTENVGISTQEAVLMNKEARSSRGYPKGWSEEEYVLD